MTRPRRAELLAEVRPLVTALAGHPGSTGSGPVARSVVSAGWTPAWRGLVPLRPELVCEVAYDHADHGRFRHPARWWRWRPDREPASCRLDQLTGAGAGSGRGPSVADVLGASP